MISQHQTDPAETLSASSTASTLFVIAAETESNAAAAGGPAPAFSGEHGDAALRAVDLQAIQHGPAEAAKDPLVTRLGPELIALYQAGTLSGAGSQAAAGQTGESGELSSAALTAMTVVDGRVVVDATAASGDGQALLAALTALGLEGGASYGAVVSGSLPIEALAEVAGLAALQSIRPAYSLTSLGAAQSQGDIAMRLDDARAANQANGSGVMIGVLSDTYNALNGATMDIIGGDLPGTGNPNGYTTPIVVLEDLAVGTDEGRAMLQLIHDAAPGASLAFHTAKGGMANFAQGILDLAAAGADVIVDDVIYFAEPMFQDGIIADAINTVSAQGIPYFSSAGNQATQAIESVYRAATDTVPGSTLGSAHDFNPGAGTDVRLSVTVPGKKSVTIVLQWDDPYGSQSSGGNTAQTDLDLYLLTPATNTVQLSSKSNNLASGDPVEVITAINNNVNSVTVELVIDHFAGPAPNQIKLAWFGALTVNEFPTNSGTVYGHSAAEGGQAVGAAFYANTPEFGVNPPVLESFSSRGLTPIYFDTDGNRLAVPELRQTPDIVAPDGNNTTFFGSPDSDGDGFKNFYGTSASAPNAAAAAAVMLDALTDATPAEIYAALQATAIDMNAVGIDSISGAGLIQADAALYYLTGASNAADTIFGSDGADNLSGLAGHDQVNGNAGDDLLIGANGHDSLLGGNGNDTLTGEADNDSLGAGEGGDSLSGGNGNDTLLGEGGNDTLLGGPGADSLAGGPGIDFVSYLGNAAVSVNLATGLASGGDATGDTLSGIENIEGTANGDTLTGDDADNLITGLGAGDRLFGGNGNDTVDAGTGGDTVLGGNGNDSMLGGSADDTLSGEDGADTLDGGEQNDTLSGGEGQDVLLGGNSNDSLTGGNGNDTLQGGDGRDSLTAEAGEDSLDGGEGNDTLAGGTEADTLLGGDGLDTLDGGDGADSVAAGNREDLVTGGNGGDTLLGEDGNDTLTGGADGDAAAGGAGTDSLDGGEGGDSLDGGTDADSLGGGSGNDTLLGDEGDDSLNAGDGGDSLSGGNGSDQLAAGNEDDAADAGSGNDTVDGGTGNDSLSGGEDADLLTGGAGGDSLDGGNGTDLASYAAGLGGVAVDLVTGLGSGGDAAGDTLAGIENLEGSAAGDDTLTGDAGNNLIAGLGGGDQLFGADGNDTLDGGQGSDLALGGNGGDSLAGGTGNDTAAGNDGDDTLVGGSGGDSLDGGAGTDIASYATAPGGVAASLGTGLGTVGDAAGDTLTGIETLEGSEAGADTLAGDATANLLRGLGGADNLSGADGDDTIDGGTENDLAAGGNGLDSLVGAAGADTLDGGNADDILEGGAGGDSLQGGAGSDIARYAAAPAGVALSLATGLGTAGDANGDSLSGIETVEGSDAGNDTLAGDDFVNVLRGLGGSDVLSGGNGGDVLEGHGGSDSLLGEADADTLNGDDGNDTLLGGAGADSLVGGNNQDMVSYAGSTAVTINLQTGVVSGGDAAGDTLSGIEDVIGSNFGDSMAGSSGANAFRGGNGNDTLDGSAGDDYIEGGAGGDSLSGGLGANALSYLGSDAAVSVSLATFSASGGHAAGDSIAAGTFRNLYGSTGFSDALVGDTSGNLIIGDGGNDTVYGLNGADYADGGSGDDFIEGGAGADTIDGGAGINLVSYQESAAAVTVNLETNVNLGGDAAGDLLFNIARVLGSTHADTLIGRSVGNNELIGGAGADTATGGGGFDAIYGFDGDDHLVGFGSDDYLDGGNGNDSLDGADGRDDIYGGDGNDTVLAGEGVPIDLVLGGAGQDSIDGQGGDDVLFGEGGDDTVQGGNGADWVQGDAGNDSLMGGANPVGTLDWIEGGNGNDTIDGGAGGDWLVGGAGSDRFVFTTGSGPDAVSDFNAASDQVWVAINGNGAPIDDFADLIAQNRIIDTGPDTLIELSLIRGTFLHYAQLVGVGNPADITAANVIFF